MPLDLLVIHPGAAHGIYGSELAQSLVAVEPPLWCRLIAGYVRDHGFSVEIMDAEALGATPDEIAGYVETIRPRLVCLAVYGHQPSASSQQMYAAGLVARAIKQDQDIPIIMVGGHVSALPERTMQEEAIDYACVGEGPITIVGLLKWLKPVAQERGTLGDVPGLVHWDAKYGELHTNPSALLIEDLSQLHGNVWDMLPMAVYRSHNWQCFGDLSKRQPYASIYTSLGCPYKCSFCCINAPFGGYEKGHHSPAPHRYRMRKPVDVVDEIVMLYRKYGVRTFKIVDEMYVLNEKHYTAIANCLIASGISDDINIWAYARVDTVRPNTLALLRKAGIRWLALGIESASAYVRDGAQKRLKNNDILQVVRAIQAADINVIGNFIFGLPDDNLDTMHETLRLALELNCEFANFYSAMAYPGSPLYLEAVSKGWALPGSWRGYSQHNDDCRPLDTLHIDAATVLKFRDDAFNIYFQSPAYLKKIGDKFGIGTYQHVKDMTKVKLKRKLLDRRYAPEERMSSQ